MDDVTFRATRPRRRERQLRNRAEDIFDIAINSSGGDGQKKRKFSFILDGRTYFW